MSLSSSTNSRITFWAPIINSKFASIFFFKYFLVGKYLRKKNQFSLYNITFIWKPYFRHPCSPASRSTSERENCDYRNAIQCKISYEARHITIITPTPAKRLKKKNSRILVIRQSMCGSGRVWSTVFQALIPALYIYT